MSYYTVVDLCTLSPNQQTVEINRLRRIHSRLEVWFNREYKLDDNDCWVHIPAVGFVGYDKEVAE